MQQLLCVQRLAALVCLFYHFATLLSINNNDSSIVNLVIVAGYIIHPTNIIIKYIHINNMESLRNSKRGGSGINRDSNSLVGMNQNITIPFNNNHHHDIDSDQEEDDGYDNYKTYDDCNDNDDIECVKNVPLHSAHYFRTSTSININIPASRSSSGGSSNSTTYPISSSSPAYRIETNYTSSSSCGEEEDTDGGNSSVDRNSRSSRRQHTDRWGNSKLNQQYHSSSSLLLTQQQSQQQQQLQQQTIQRNRYTKHSNQWLLDNSNTPSNKIINNNDSTFILPTYHHQQQHSTTTNNPEETIRTVVTTRSTSNIRLLPYVPSTPSSNNNGGVHSSPTNMTSIMNNNSPIMNTDNNINNNNNQSNIINKFSNKARWLICMFILISIIVVCLSEMNVLHVSDKVMKLEMNIKDNIDMKIHKYEKDIRVLEREIDAMDIMIRKQQEVLEHRSMTNQYHYHDTSGIEADNAMREMKSLQDRLKKESLQAIELKHKVQVVSKADVISKYGPGPHRIEIELYFPEMNHASNTNPKTRSIKEHKNNNNNGNNKFIIELASVDMMPHSIHTFLEMVSLGLLDGCSFIMNALHVVKAAPLPYDGTSAAQKAKDFQKHGLDSVAFKEYNDLYPHKQYTIGFAADGSPSFYINTEDNSEIHIGDPCFGKVIHGFDTIHKLESSPTRNGIWFEKRIGIVKATIL